MAKKDIEDIVCKPFCSFYREGLKEQLICRGAEMVAEMLKNRLLSPGTACAVNREPHMSAWDDSRLEAVLCRTCVFEEDGCDFQSTRRDRDTEPCGGYILLKLLTEKGLVTFDRPAEKDDD